VVLFKNAARREPGVADQRRLAACGGCGGCGGYSASMRHVLDAGPRQSSASMAPGPLPAARTRRAANNRPPDPFFGVSKRRALKQHCQLLSRHAPAPSRHRQLLFQ
jgi:hypothetical protein